jgi:hypothetical protein
MATPLIRIPQVSGGVFYAFASASKDLSKTFNNDQLKFQFSKYALLNIPNIQVPLNKENFIQFLSIDGAIYSNDGTPNADNNVNLAESFQNYALNLEALLMADNDFDTGVKRSVAERVFFKWLKEIGAVRFRDASTTEKSVTAPSNIYTEEDTATSGTRRYSRVVEYLGDIDVTNNVDKGGQAYTEIYFNVPSRVGNTPTVLFNSISDANYMPNMVITNNSEYIYGRNSSTIQPDGLSTFSFYDQDTTPPNLATSPGAWWWYPENTPNSYFTDIVFTDPTSQQISKSDDNYPGITFTTLNYLRSKLDGISIDWTADDYYDIAVDPKISTIQEYNSTNKAANFSFNAILVYYDLYDNSTPSNRATNLYGVILLDNITDTPTSSYIQRLEKFKPNKVTGLNGNSYGLKLNLNFDTSVDNSTIETVINDYSQFSMDLFIDASVQLQESTRILLDSQSQILELNDRINLLETMIFSNEDLTEVRNRLTSLEAQVNNAQLAFSSSTSLIDLIANTNDTITQIVNGTIPVNLQYNVDVLRNGAGIALDKSTPNRIKVNNVIQAFNVNLVYSDSNYNTLITSSSPLDLNVTSGIKAYLKLEEFTNMVRINTVNSAASDIKIYIDDSAIKFKEGQTIRFSFDTTINMNGKNLIIYTDASNRFGSGSLGLVIGTISTSDISTKPIFELTCLNDSEYTFAIDILR